MITDTQAAWKYHNETKHSWESVRTDRHYLDWSNLPLPFKIYKDRPSIQLPDAEPLAQYPALAAIADSDSDLNGGNQLTLSALATILHYSAGVTRERLSPGGKIWFRAAACAGALYPIEVYVVSARLDALAPGVYHFNPHDRAFFLLREGDCHDALTYAVAGQPDIASARVVLVFTAISWRSAWKYRSRAYRYHYWDNGTMLANAIAACAALNLPAKLVMGFADREISRLVGIDGRRELPLSLLAIGSRSKAQPRPVPEPAQELPELSFETVPLSACEIEYPLIPYMHRESELANAEQVLDWRRAADRSVIGTANSGTDSSKTEGPRMALKPYPIQTIPTDSIGDVILRRASTRRFARKPISFQDLSTILDRSTRGLASDFAPADIPLNEVYLIVNRVDDLAPGGYYYRRQEMSLELLEQGDFSEEGRYLTLEQDLGGDSSATIFYMADLEQVLKRLGNRGYRAAQIEAAIIAGKQYIAAYALHRGATGLTFYDDDVTAFFSPHAAGKACMLALSIGVPGKRPIV